MKIEEIIIRPINKFYSRIFEAFEVSREIVRDWRYVCKFLLTKFVDLTFNISARRSPSFSPRSLVTGTRVAIMIGIGS